MKHHFIQEKKKHVLKRDKKRLLKKKTNKRENYSKISISKKYIYYI